MLKEKNRKRKWRASIRKCPVNHKIYKEDEKSKKWAAKKTKPANAQITTHPNGVSFPLKTTQFQIVVCQFLAGKHSIVVLKRMIYICQKAQTKKLKLSKSLRQNTN